MVLSWPERLAHRATAGAWLGQRAQIGLRRLANRDSTLPRRLVRLVAWHSIQPLMVLDALILVTRFPAWIVAPRAFIVRRWWLAATRCSSKG